MGAYFGGTPSGCESGRLAGWLDTEADGWMEDKMMLDPEMSPISSVRSAAVSAFLATKSEVFSLAVLTGGVIAEAALLAAVVTVTARVSVLPVVGSELPADSDAAVVVTEYVDDWMRSVVRPFGFGGSLGRICMTSVVS